MSKYKTLLFDIDETLLNFIEGQRNALTQLFNDQKVELTLSIRQRYEAKNAELWHRFEKGEIEKEQVLTERFTYIFNACGYQKDGQELNRIFLNYLKEEAILIDGAFDLIQTLSQTHELYVVTNGVSDVQYRRIAKANLEPYFNQVFVSEDTGFNKPMPEFFDYVFERIEGLERESTLIIGDSLVADIKGGNNAKISSCWYNPNQVENLSKIIPTYEISHLGQLYEIV